ncbi:General transcription factor II-I repeat domain-containing protein 2B-like [Oopsacas minuta]|uniref:General transcription factor II-I repeat domain-containing protein 2B-like n=1 Tax=Oopsacas minuta TaxID=111878 RepID=A0AAV7JU38_9METZ|nr:General transcription factor II-I repeat domain-containing protein 2B-like [Oopsacas minuta]
MHQSLATNLSADEKTKKIEALKKELRDNKSVFLKFHDAGEKPMHASYAVANKIARDSKSFSDYELIKECIDEVIKIMCPDKLQEFERVFCQGGLLLDELKI